VFNLTFNDTYVYFTCRAAAPAPPRRSLFENLVASSPVASWLKVRSWLWRKSNAAFIHHLEFAASRI
jgi:hypothetical protein